MPGEGQKAPCPCNAEGAAAQQGHAKGHTVVAVRVAPRSVAPARLTAAEAVDGGERGRGERGLLRKSTMKGLELWSQPVRFPFFRTSPHAPRAAVRALGSAQPLGGHARGYLSRQRARQYARGVRPCFLRVRLDMAIPDARTRGGRARCLAGSTAAASLGRVPRTSQRGSGDGGLG